MEGRKEVDLRQYRRHLKEIVTPTSDNTNNGVTGLTMRDTLGAAFEFVSAAIDVLSTGTGTGYPVVAYYDATNSISCITMKMEKCVMSLVNLMQ